jgi:hypothetical protein
MLPPLLPPLVLLMMLLLPPPPVLRFLLRFLLFLAILQFIL